MDVELREAGREDTPVLLRLMQLYLYDLGTIDGWDVGDDGLYCTAALIEGFWTDPKRRSFLVRVGGRLAGFVLIDRKSTRLNSSHLVISYAVFCLKKKIQTA